MGLSAPLPARLSEPARTLLGKGSGLLRELAYGLRGPYHVLLPDRFAANLTAFLEVLEETGVTGEVHYAKKANKAACWIETCAELGAGVDVASVPELRDALGHGVRGTRIVVTGPAKSDDLLRLAVRHDCLITVDALDELDRVAALDGARIMLRVTPPSQPHSRFGMTPQELERALERCGPPRLEGFSCHLSGYEVGPRAEMAALLLRWCERARARGIPATRISVGGGFAVDYLAAEDWRRFTDDPAHFHAGRRFDGFYPYHSPVAGAAALRAVLAARPGGGSADVAALLRGSGVTLILEPGRALLDQAGLTVFRIQGVKDARHGREYGIVTVDGTSLSLSEQWFNSEFLPEPVPVPAREGPASESCVGGASCLESDMLTWRRITLPGRPRRGDLLVYPNTAGYQMDSNESPFHGLPLPPKVVVNADGSWRLDRPPA
ncbi:MULTISPECIES: alanine racemase [Streptosporangium]|uniref:Diaminopimelate decarboxylase n=1 Tax=Streptosporangium brasiliense TaxID=47480 RepID=A0ABT9RLM5_9ACTN|nr:alanine racemase [Streptosporangium brasiliense]MDP9870204.1 diaminopimelate decarboxylase [Streptosporangium brasiliense]